MFKSIFKTQKTRHAQPRPDDAWGRLPSEYADAPWKPRDEQPSLRISTPEWYL